MLYAFNLIVGLGLTSQVWRKKVEKWNYLLILTTLLLVAANVSQLLAENHLLSAFRAETLIRLPYYTVYLSAVLFCFITLYFSRANTPRRLWTLIAVLFGLAIVGVYELDILRPRLATPRIEWLALGWAFFTFVATLNMLTIYRHTVYPLHRNRFKYWFIALVILATGSTLVFSGQVALGYSVLGICTVLLAIISLTHQLPDMRQIVKQSTVSLFEMVIRVSAYIGVFLLVYTAIPHPNLELYALAAVIASFGLTLFVNPFVAYFKQWISRLISSSNIDSVSFLGNYSKNIANIIDIHQLASAAIDYISAAMRFEFGELFISVPAGDDYVLQRIQRGLTAAAGEAEEPHQLGSNSPIVNWFREDRRPITQYDLDFHPKLSAARPEEKQWIADYRMDIFIPIYWNERWIGLLGFGPKTNGDRIFDEEISALQSLASQTAVALQNARLYEDLKHHNAENERLNLDLSKANQELSRLDQAKTDFISIASHEIRTPLTQIIGYNDILGDMVKGGNIPHTAGQQMVEGVHKAARRLEDIVDTMFDVSQLDTSSLVLRLDEIKMADVLSYTVDKWAKALETRRQTILLKGLSALPPVRGDELRLRQIFVSLVQNAIKYTPDGGQIMVSGSYAGGSDYVEILVQDTGIGINPADLERIFEKFYRVGNVMLHSSGETKFKGAGPGLGLTIAKGIIAAHGGEIWAESPGQDEIQFPGSTFHIRLPITPLKMA